MPLPSVPTGEAASAVLGEVVAWHGASLAIYAEDAAVAGSTTAGSRTVNVDPSP
jgi:hypothetical protein